MNEKQILSIQALRGVAVLGVVAFHTLAIELKYSGGDRWLSDLLLFGETGVDLFFVISGFVMVLVTRGRFGKPREVMRFFWSRTTRIYPTYWFYFFLTLGIFLVMPAWVNASQGHQVNLWKSFFLFPDHTAPLVLVAWSLIHELWFYLVFGLLLLFREKIMLPALLVWGVLIIAVNSAVNVETLVPWQRIVLHAYTLQFIIGALVAYFVQQQVLRNLAPVYGWVLLVLGMAGLVLACLNQAQDKLGLGRALILGAVYGLILMASVLLERSRSLRPSRFLSFVGDISYTVYLSHVLVLSVIGRLWLAWGPLSGNLVDDVLIWLVMMAAVITYGWVAYRLLEEPTVKWAHQMRTRVLG